MDSFGVLEVFVAVIENGSFSGAAKKLEVSKSAVSKRVSQLEVKLGVRLLHRTTRKLSLTEAGQRYFEHALKALSAAKEAEDAVSQMQDLPKGLLRINAPMSFGRLYLSKIVPEFLKTFPDVEISLQLDDKKVDLVAGGYDIAIRVGELADSTLVARKLAPCISRLCASPDYITEYGMPVAPEDLTRHNCVLFSYSSDVNVWSLSNGENHHQVQVSGNYRVNNSEALKEAISQGVGIGRLPLYVSQAAVASGELIPVLPDYQLPEQSFYAVFPERQFLPAKVRVFIDFLIQKFSEQGF
ncbi:LysR family transcriptional regulator [Litoribacillus peritrichatus]|uniref:LysR family transcriptional regulator n=1 Tax=Litoribacillus peritrichatus TaxID=718191 RepID=A0ABP7N0T1_9GAMM